MLEYQSLNETDVRQMKIVLPTVTLRPERSELKRDLQTGAWMVHALIKCNEEIHEQLIRQWKNTDYFEVNLQDGSHLNNVSDTPLSMRWGECAWSNHGNRYKWFFRLLEEKFDDGRNYSLRTAHERHHQEKTVGAQQALRKLIEYLEREDLLAPSIATDLRSRLDTPSREAQLQHLYQVDDVEKYRLW